MKNINWKVAIFLSLYHLGLLILLPIYFMHATIYSSTINITIILLIITELSITAGYHRLFSHKTFIANKPLQFFLLLFGTMTAQGSALKWAHDHRIHHNKIDSDEDPYNIKKGFWYAHVLWLLEKEKPINKILVTDLIKNKLVSFQHKYYNVLFVITNLIAVISVGLVNTDFLGAFLLVWWTRLFFSHHLTWFINSLAHMWGRKPYNKKISAVDNEIMAILTFGEGYHNYHHSFANDYRNGIKWYQFDPTKWLIWTLAKFGLAKKLKKINKYTIKRRKILEDKKELLEKLNQIISVKKENLEMMIHDLSERISKNVNEIRKLKNERKEYYEKTYKIKIKILKRNLNNDFNAWKHLSKVILHLS